MEELAMLEYARDGASNAIRLRILTDAIFNAARLNYSGKSSPLTTTSFAPCFGQCSRMTTTACLRI